MRLAFLALLLLPTPAFADAAVVHDVATRETSTGWQISVTLEHGDTGWDDYADGWRIEDAEGTVLGTRVLHHPHVEEQPFARAVSGVDIPPGTPEIFIRARTNVEGWAEDRAGPFPIPSE